MGEPKADCTNCGGEGVYDAEWFQGTLRRGCPCTNPVKVRMLKVVESDLGKLPLVAIKGREYAAELNPHGAVSAVIGNPWLGLKPGEFEFVIDALEAPGMGGGRTELRDRTWIVTPKDLTKLCVRFRLERMEGFWQWVTEPILSFCESVHASGQSKWHLRPLTTKSKKLGGGVDTPSLCGLVKDGNGWDLETNPDDHDLTTVACRECMLAVIGTWK